MRIFHIIIAAVLLALGGAASAEPLSAAQHDAAAKTDSVRNVVFVANSVAAAKDTSGASIAQRTQLMVAGNPSITDMDSPSLTAAPMEANPTPLPGALWLFGSALVGFLGFSSRRKV